MFIQLQPAVLLQLLRSSKCVYDLRQSLTFIVLLAQDLIFLVVSAPLHNNEKSA